MTWLRLFAACSLACMLFGCSKAPEEPRAGETKTMQPALTPAAAQNGVEKTQAYKELHQSFKEATVEETPLDVKRPPDETATGKKVPALLEKISGLDGKGGLWEQIRFMTPQGKPIPYEAIIKTDLGDIRVELLPEAAPNHVRNFIALARTGYYDGLAFDLIIKQQMPICLVAGCPLRTGDVGHGSIGYWLKPEISTKLLNEEGTFGAWHEEALDSAACKFYITFTRADWMDGRYSIFGRIIDGLDVARKIGAAPQQMEDGEETGFPERPVNIQTVTIITK